MKFTSVDGEEQSEMQPEESLAFKEDPMHRGEGHKHRVVPFGVVTSRNGSPDRIELAATMCDHDEERPTAQIIISTSYDGKQIHSFEMGIQDMIDFISEATNLYNAYASLVGERRRLKLFELRPQTDDPVSQILEQHEPRGNG